MLFTTYSYFLFLLLAVVGHWALPPGRLRSVWLIACSLVFYTVTQGAFVLVLLGYVLFNWWGGRQLATQRERRALLWIILIADLLPLLYFKYWPAVAQGVPHGPPGAWFAPVTAPLGISFFAFQASA
jgi:D-alanyl-lipoteichoic acid acyltransferase DltB (MBOAT superfamily)